MDSNQRLYQALLEFETNLNEHHEELMSKFTCPSLVHQKDIDVVCENILIHPENQLHHVSNVVIEYQEDCHENYYEINMLKLRMVIKYNYDWSIKIVYQSKISPGQHYQTNSTYAINNNAMSSNPLKVVSCFIIHLYTSDLDADGYNEDLFYAFSSLLKCCRIG